MFRISLMGAAVAALMLAAPAAIAAPGAAGHSHSGDEASAIGRPGNAKQPALPVLIVMNDADGKMSFTPNRVDVQKGQQVRFIIRNNGQLDHEFVLNTLQENLEHAEEMKKNPEMEHDDPNSIRLAPGKSGQILWQFTTAGEFNYSCLIPGHRESGMTGTVVVD